MFKRKGNILVVDDDKVTRKVISFALEKSGYKVFGAENSKDAMNALKTQDYDLVFCDIMMNDMNGFEFCGKVRSEEKFKALPFIFITSKNNPEDKETAFRIGADDFITKPFNASELITKTDSILKRVEIYKMYGLRKKFEDDKEVFASKVLIVDDDIIILNILQKQLEKEGIICYTAINAREGYKIASEILPDLIVSDFIMPDIDGFEFRKMLSGNNKLREIPFVFLTADESDNLILQGFDMDIKDYIFKSLKPNIIAAKLINIIKDVSRERKAALKELKLAADNISMEVVPSSALQIEGYEITQLYIPYKGIPGGDFIDYIRLDDNNLAVILGDVMGKKWGAWFFAFSFIGYIRSAVRLAFRNSDRCTASEILKKVNETMYFDAKISEVFSTVSVLIINNKNNIIQYSGAGDLPLIFFENKTSNVKDYKSNGLLLGINPDGEYNNTEIYLDYEDSVTIYTDGVIESTDNNSEQFGLIKLIDTIKNSGGKDITNFVRDTVLKFTGNKTDDDFSIINIKRKFV